VWLLVSIFALSLSSCAELALPPEQLFPQPTAVLNDVSVNAEQEAIINIAPTPTPVSTALPTEAPLPATRATALPIPPTVTPVATPTPVAAFAKLATACTETQGALKDGFFKSQILERRQHYFVYLPPCYDSAPAIRYPVIYLLHGVPMDEHHWLDEGVVRAADKLIGSGELPPFLMVMPHGDNSIYTDTSGGDKSFEGVFVNDLVPFIDSTYWTVPDAAHRSLGGISRGGVWALEIAFTHPDMFNSVGGHSPALSVNRAGSDYDPEALAKTAPIDKLRIFLDAGDSDWTRFETLNLSKILNDRYIPYTFTIGKGDHDYPYWASQVEAYLKFYGAPWKVEKVVEKQLSAVPAQ
jgi:enterochelin esterase-like enzyme